RTSTDSLSPSVPELSGTDIELSLTLQPVNSTGRRRQATLINQCLPGPLLRVKEGQQVRLTVYHHLPVDSSRHRHGLLVRSDMDGVPGLSFDGIKSGGHYQYVFTLKQSGTYWYHSHSGYQEQTGLYGAIIIEPLQPEPFQMQRDYVLLLSDWSDETPQAIEAK